MTINLASAIHDLHQSLKKIDLHTIDVGNTFIKTGIFENSELKKVLKIKESQLILESNFDHITCSVRQNIKSSFLWKQDEQCFIDAPIQYEKTLGHDRLVCAAHLYHIQKLINRSIILVDLGTFITLDHISSNGHSGGYIFPGAEIFLKSYGSGELLPRLANRENFDSSISWPQSTENAIRGATELYLRGLALQVQQMAQNSNSIILLTGGSSHLLENYLNSTTDFESFTDLIHYSLFFTHCKIANL